MKKIYGSLFFLILGLMSSAQNDKNLIDYNPKPIIQSVPYRLFPTQNMWNFIKLDTRNGQMWQVQFSMEIEGRLITSLNTELLVSKDKEINDRFTLYPTQNIFTFILLDQMEGKTWQVQWSTDPENRGIIPIK
jgi:hypothetical protein